MRFTEGLQCPRLIGCLQTKTLKTRSCHLKRLEKSYHVHPYYNVHPSSRLKTWLLNSDVIIYLFIYSYKRFTPLSSNPILALKITSFLRKSDISHISRDPEVIIPPGTRDPLRSLGSVSPCSLRLFGLAAAAIQRPAAARTKRSTIWATSWFGSLDWPIFSAFRSVIITMYRDILGHFGKMVGIKQAILRGCSGDMLWPYLYDNIDNIDFSEIPWEKQNPFENHQFPTCYTQ